jgi:hypothetical protein
MVIGIQALCFSLAALLVAKGGAVYASLVTGLLLSGLRPGFFPFSLLFSLFYGLIIEKVDFASDCCNWNHGCSLYVPDYDAEYTSYGTDNVLGDNCCGNSQWGCSGVFDCVNLEQVSFSSFSLIKSG